MIVAIVRKPYAQRSLRSWSPPSCDPCDHLETIDSSDHCDRLDRCVAIARIVAIVSKPGLNGTRLIKWTPNGSISLQKDNSALSKHSCLAIAWNSSSIREYHQRLCLQAWQVHFARGSWDRDDERQICCPTSVVFGTQKLYLCIYYHVGTRKQVSSLL